MQHLLPILHQNFRTILAVGIAVPAPARVMQGLQVALALPLLIQQTLVTLAVVIVRAPMVPLVMVLLPVMVVLAMALVVLVLVLVWQEVV